MNDISQTDVSNEWRKGWPIILASLVGIALCLSPLPYWALIIIGSELSNEFGWSANTRNAGFLYMTAGVLIGAPVAGQLVDRFGSRRVLLPSIIFLSLGMCAFSMMTENPTTFYTIFFFTAFLGSGTLPITWTKAITNNFDEHRGLALGIALTGTGLFGFLAPTYIQSFIDGYGWRTAYIAVGVLPLIFSLPLAFMLFRDKKEDAAIAKVAKNSEGFRTIIIGVVVAIALFLSTIYTINNHGVIPLIYLMAIFLALYVAYIYWMEGRMPEKDANLPGLSVRETLHDYRFWIIFFAFMILGGVVSGLIANSKNILEVKNYTAADATGYFTGAGLIGLATLMGRLLGGYLVDRIWAPLIAFVFMTVPVIGCYILMQDYSMGVNAIALILIGLAAGVEFDLMAFFASRYFGMRSYGRIYGLVYAAFGLGSGTSPIIFSLLSGDKLVNYPVALKYFAVGFVVGGFMCLFLGKYRDFETV